MEHETTLDNIRPGLDWEGSKKAACTTTCRNLSNLWGEVHSSALSGDVSQGLFSQAVLEQNQVDSKQDQGDGPGVADKSQLPSC